MGFSLKMFIEDLEDIFQDPFLDKTTKLLMLEEIVQRAKVYAKECGQL